MAQKDSKDIVKIVHVTSVVQPSFYEATRITFCARGKQTDNVLSMKGQKALRLNQKHISISVPKMKESLTGLERHEGE